MDRYLNNTLKIFIIFFVLVLFISIFKIFEHNNSNLFFYYIYLIISLLNIALVYYLLFQTNYKKIWVLFFYIVCLVIFYSLEVYFIYKPYNIWEEYERVTENNIKIIPHTNKRYYKYKNKTTNENEEIYTLSGVSNVGMVLTKENGFYPLIKRDKYGWHNQNSIYTNYEAVIIGDSFVEGWSVKSKENISSSLNKLGLKTINLGFANNTPLHMYAVYREYINEFKPKYIFWFYTDDDLYELQESLKDRNLSKYLNNKSYNQNLILRQKQIDDSISSYVVNIWNIEKMRRVRKYINLKKNRNIYLRTFKLTELRERLGFYNKNINIDKNNNKYFEVKLNNSTIKNYEKIIKNIAEDANKNQSNVFFVYLPSKSNFLDEKVIIDQNKINLDKILNIANKNNLKIINLYSPIKNYEKPEKIYSRHLNKEGYEFVAESLYNFVLKSSP